MVYPVLLPDPEAEELSKKSSREEKHTVARCIECCNPWCLYLPIQETIEILVYRILGSIPPTTQSVLSLRRDRLAWSLRNGREGASYSDIIEHLWMFVQGGVEESNRCFALLQPLFVQQVDNACENGR
jgi:hypothetical protein